MKLLRLSIFLILSIPIFCSGQSKDFARVSIINCGIGTDIYSMFGHIGVRINRGNNDLVYNFGTFDPSIPQFLSKYIKGDLDYTLSIETYNQFIVPYIYEGREVQENQLSLSEKEISDLETELRRIYNSDARFYKYQFLKDNCSTRVFKLINDVLGKIIIEPKDSSLGTFRGSLNETLIYNSLYRLPINCLLGRVGEQVLSTQTKSYLPDSLVKTFTTTNLTNPTSGFLIKKSEVVLKATNGLRKIYLDYITTLIVLVCFFLLRSKWVFVATGLFGIIIVFLMLYSNREEFACNYNVLIFNPIDMCFCFERFKEKSLIYGSILFNIVYVLIYFMLSVNYLPLLLINLGMVYFKIKMIARIGEKRQALNFSRIGTF